MTDYLNQDDGLMAYFTDMEDLQVLFKQNLSAPRLERRILVIHGVGGVGKSSLLRMFRLHSKKAGVLVGLASGDEAKSAVDVLARWAEDLKADGVKLKDFAATYQQYRVVQAKVEEHARKAQDLRGKAMDSVGKAASKAAVEAAASLIPVVGPIASALGGMGAEALFGWLRGFLSTPESDLYLDPTKRLTDDFHKSIDKAAGKQRLVLMLDTFEQMAILDEWVREFARRLHCNVLLVIAGRGVPNWSRPWPEWMAQAMVHELNPMTEEIMRQLIRRYFAFIRGGEPDPKQVEAIVQFARGLPMVVNSAVRLWVEYGIEDFQAVKSKVVADLVDRLRESMPEKLYPVLEAAAILRWFNKGLLRVITCQSENDDLYDELCRFPFVRPRLEGLVLHDSVRELIDENLKIQDPERHRKLHEIAAAYFDSRTTNAVAQDIERMGLERLYHCICADEEMGMRLFLETAEGMTRFRLISRLSMLLNDLDVHSLHFEGNKLWCEYYRARLSHIKGNLAYAEQIYRAIGANSEIEPKLRAYALCDLGSILMDRDRGEQLCYEEAIVVLEQALELAPEMDSKLIYIYIDLSTTYMQSGKLDNLDHMESILQKQLFSFSEVGDHYGIIRIIRDMSYRCGWRGKWREAINLHRRAYELASAMSGCEALKAEILERPWMFIFSGQLHEAEEDLTKAIHLWQQTDHLQVPILYSTRDLAFIFGLQGQHERANKMFAEVSDSLEKLNRLGDRCTLLGFWGYILVREGTIEQAKRLLRESWEIKKSVGDSLGFQEVLNWLGLAEEVSTSPDTKPGISAEIYYLQSLSYRWTGRRHFECGALVGLVRSKYEQGDLTTAASFATEAEQLAQQYEYNDHLASLRLTQAQIAWESEASEHSGLESFATALRYYQHALIHALRFNRFMLDEVLWGGGICTPLRPIIPTCLEHGEEGRRMLIALRDWWQTGCNDTGTPRPDTISPVPEGIPLLEAERIARRLETGDGKPQVTVIEKLEEALGNG